MNPRSLKLHKGNNAYIQQHYYFLNDQTPSDGDLMNQSQSSFTQESANTQLFNKIGHDIESCFLEYKKEKISNWQQTKIDNFDKLLKTQIYKYCTW